MIIRQQLKLSLLFSVFLAGGCALVEDDADKKLSSSVITTPISYYSTAKARYLGTKYKDNLGRIAERIVRNPKTGQLQFANNISSVGGIGFFTHSATETPDERYLEVVVAAPETFESKGEYSEKIQRLFSRYGAELLAIIAGDGQIFQDNALRGYGLNFTWRTVAAEGGTSGVSVARSIIYFQKEKVADFLRQGLGENELLRDAVIFATEDNGPLELVSYRARETKPDFRPAIREDNLPPAAVKSPSTAPPARAADAEKKEAPAAKKNEPVATGTKQPKAAAKVAEGPKEAAAANQLARKQDTPAAATHPFSSPMKPQPSTASSQGESSLSVSGARFPTEPTENSAKSDAAADQASASAKIEEAGTVVLEPRGAASAPINKLGEKKVPEAPRTAASAEHEGSVKAKSGSKAAPPKNIDKGPLPEEKMNSTVDRGLKEEKADTGDDPAAKENRVTLGVSAQKRTAATPEPGEVALLPKPAASIKSAEMAGLGVAKLPEAKPIKSGPAEAGKKRASELDANLPSAPPRPGATEEGRDKKPVGGSPRAAKSEQTPTETSSARRMPAAEQPRTGVKPGEVATSPTPRSTVSAEKVPTAVAKAELARPFATKTAIVPSREPNPTKQSESTDISPSPPKPPFGSAPTKPQPKPLGATRAATSLTSSPEPDKAAEKNTLAGEPPVPQPVTESKASTPPVQSAPSATETRPIPSSIREPNTDRPSGEQLALLRKPHEYTAEKKPPPRTTPRPLEGFIIQFSFSDKEKARNWAETMIQKGFAVSVTEAGVGGALRVRLGNFPAREDAERQMRNFQKQGMNGIVINLPQAFRPGTRASLP